VDLVGQYNLYSNLNNYQQYFTSFNRNSVAVGVVIRVPILHFRTSANVALAKSQLTEADLTLGKLRDDAEVEAKQNMINKADLDAALEVSRLELKLAQEDLALLQSRFDQGQAT